MEEFFSRKTYFKGLLFIGTAYLLIKLIDQYQLFFEQLKVLQVAVMPFIIAFVFAYLFNPILKVLEKHTTFKRGINLALIYVSFMLLCYLVVSFISPVIYQNASDLIKQIPGFAAEIQEVINGWSYQFSLMDLGGFNEFKSQLLSFIPKITEILTNSLSSIISAMYGAVLGTGNLLFGFILSIYILLEKESFLEMTRRILKISFRDRAQHLFNGGRLLHENIGKYLIGKSIDSIFVGVCATLGLTIMGAQYSVLLGLIFGLTNMVPFIGPIVGTLIAAGINLFYSPILALVIFVYLFIIQQIETLVIDPKVVGQKVGLNPILTLLAVTLGGKIMGIVGMILGVPVMGVLKLYTVNLINHQYEKLYPATEPEIAEETE